jgi:DNA-binding transcriptional LysR family regulator
VIGNWPKPDARFARSDLFADKVVCMMRADHPLAHEPLTREAYLAAAHLAPTPYTGSHANAIDIGFAKARAERRIVTTLPYFGLVPQVLLQSDLVFTTTRRFATHYASLLPIAVVEPPFAFPRIRCYQMWHPQPDRPSDVGWLRDLVDRVSKTLTERSATKAKAVKRAAASPEARAKRAAA